MPAIISLINLKGGVGKSTICVAMAEILAGRMGKRVLIIDMDPQTNTTFALIGPNWWKSVDQAGQTIYHMFAEFKLPRTDRLFKISKAIIGTASLVTDCSDRLSLLPSSTRMVGQAQIADTLIVLAEHLKPATLNRFDYILIDCPPNLEIITQNGLFMSDAYVIPVIPEPISILGIPQIMEAAGKLRNHHQKPIPPLGMIINCIEFGRNGPYGVHKNVLELLELYSSRSHLHGTQKRYPRILEPHIPRYIDAATILEHNRAHLSLSAKYGSHLGSWQNLIRDCQDEYAKVVGP